MTETLLNQYQIKDISFLTVALAELATDLENWNFCFVKELNADFYYENGSTAIPDGAKVLNANGGAGRRLIKIDPDLAAIFKTTEITANYTAEEQEFVYATANSPIVMLPTAIGNDGVQVSVKNAKGTGSTFIDSNEDIDDFTKQSSVTLGEEYWPSLYMNGWVGIGNSYVVGCHDNNDWVKIDLVTNIQTIVTSIQWGYGLTTDGVVAYAGWGDLTDGTIVKFDPVTDTETNIVTKVNARFRTLTYDAVDNCIRAADDYAGNTKKLYKFSTTGSELASIEYDLSTSGFTPTFPVVMGGFVFIGILGNLYKISKSTNTVVNTYPLTVSPYNMTGNPATGLLYITGSSGVVHVFDINAGIELPTLSVERQYVWFQASTGILYGSTMWWHIFGAVDTNDNYKELVSEDLPDTGRAVSHTDESLRSFDTNNIDRFDIAQYFVSLDDAQETITFISDNANWKVFSNYLGKDSLIPNSVPYKDKFTISATNVTNWYVDLAAAPSSDFHLDVEYEGNDWDETEDYTISGNRITFVSIITETDKLVVKYYA